MVLRHGIVAAGVGIVLGLLGATLLTRLMANMLCAVEPLDAVKFVAVSAAMVATALIACWLPARRATRVDPLVSLRGVAAVTVDWARHLPVCQANQTHRDGGDQDVRSAQDAQRTRP